MSTKRVFRIFAYGLLSALIFGALFGILGFVFADNLGFHVAPGTEELSMEASTHFYAGLGLPIGALVGTYFASKRR